MPFYYLLSFIRQSVMRDLLPFLSQVQNVENKNNSCRKHMETSAPHISRVVLK